MESLDLGLYEEAAVLREHFVKSTQAVPVTLLLVFFSVLLRMIRCNKETILLETVKEVCTYCSLLVVIKLWLHNHTE